MTKPITRADPATWSGISSGASSEPERKPDETFAFRSNRFRFSRTSFCRDVHRLPRDVHHRVSNRRYLRSVRHADAVRSDGKLRHHRLPDAQAAADHLATAAGSGNGWRSALIRAAKSQWRGTRVPATGIYPTGDRGSGADRRD